MEIEIFHRNPHVHKGKWAKTREEEIKGGG